MKTNPELISQRERLNDIFQYNVTEEFSMSDYDVEEMLREYDSGVDIVSVYYPYMEACWTLRALNSELNNMRGLVEDLKVGVLSESGSSENKIYIDNSALL